MEKIPTREPDFYIKLLQGYNLSCWKIDDQHSVARIMLKDARELLISYLNDLEEQKVKEMLYAALIREFVTK